jgi:phage tail sheath protein FI
MATTYKTPGAYIEEIPKLPPSVAPVDTAVPAFIGYTERATDEVDGDLLLKPKRIESLVEFEQYFGGPQPETGLVVNIATTTTASPGNPIGVTSSVVVNEATRSKHVLYYAMQMFYANGGKSCFVVSVGGFKAVATALDGDELAAALEPLSKVDEPTLIVIPEAQSLPIADYAALQDAALTQCNDLKDRFVIMDVNGDDEPLADPGSNLIDAVANFRNAGPGQFLKYGAAYAPNLSTILDYAYDEDQVQVSHVVDGGAPATSALSALASNELRERAVTALRAKDLVLPPSGAIAGVYAKVDNDRGVWKAPANVPLVAVVRPTIEMGNVQNDAMNVDPTAGKSVNAIRPFVGKGTLVWGARTLAGNDNEWRYVSVRRFFTFVEESVKKATDQFTFEPNDANTWVKVQAMIENFLTTQWRAGALQGIKPEHAFYVAVGLGRTMTPLDILEGRMIVQIGMAAVRPAEFIVLRFSHKMAES